MPLSEHEQRVLDELEQDLGQDPSLHRAMNKTTKTPKRLIIGIVGVVVGLCVVVAGVATQMPILGILGFVLMAGAALWTLLGSSPSVPNTVPGSPRNTAPRSSGGAAQPKNSGEHKDFMKRFEDRFDRRRENGDF
ncbi:DUF3040 domain-containing protein [Demequina sediminicola]|uniref:DUF3040 domain-containing protein n=1 Tax=Demequina sediminicola TaxID=1095026 RepID=UPI000781AF82|nr:DUF3040 domain-containing protein [Demequina sediminicola]